MGPRGKSEHPPFLNAGNAGPFTLDGTRSYKVGERRAVVIDPGPDVASHVRALVSWVADADQLDVLLTHGHGDHAGAALSFAHEVGGRVCGPPGLDGVDVPLSDGASIETDQGTLAAVHTPGHTANHLAYHWVDRDALFVGDLLLGRGDTTWVGEYPGCVADYLASLERVRAMDLAVAYPTHGPPLDDPADVLNRFEAHRRQRIAQVEGVLAKRPELTAEELLVAVYGRELPDGVRRAAMMSLDALREYVEEGRPRA